MLTKKINNFCHLHTHNMFSLLDGMGSSDQWAEQAKNLGFKYLAITNHSNIDGLIKHQLSCEKYKISSILGVEFYIVPNPEIKEKGDKRGHLTVWIKDEIGFQNVCKMLSRANLYFFYHRPRIGYDMFLEHCQGLCVGTACSASFLHLENGIDFLKDIHQKIGSDLYLEVMPHNYEDQFKTNKLCLSLNKELDIKLIATQDAHYILKEDWESHDVLLACQTKKKMSDPDRWQFNGKDFYLCEPKYYKQKFISQNILSQEEINQAMQNTIEVAEKCKDFKIKKKKIILPIPPQFEGKDEEEIIRQLCDIGFKDKFETVTDEYKNRFEYELSVIKDFEVIKYFLIVYDLVNWCKKNNILTGPGRGSSAGCLISYLLGITKVDPIKYGLLFERFLNPGRKGAMPDVDLDFEDIKRNQVVTYLKDIYGQNNIAGISTFLKIEDKGAVKEVSRAFDVPLVDAEKFTKVIVDTVENGLLTEEGRGFNQKYPQVVKHVLKLKGTYKSYGRHASASLVSPVDLMLGTRTALSERNDQLVASFDGNDCEYQGLVKLDILGLSTLSVISMCLELIKQNHDKNINLEKLNLEDKVIYKELSKGHTVGCFQVSAWALSNLIKEMGVSNIKQISDAVAAVRPGAFNSGATARYIERKRGKKWDKKHPIYEEITKETFGVVLFQEQVIQIINKIAGLSLTVGDKIRKIIAKKRDIKEFEQYKDIFVKGCLEQKTFDEREALEFWHELEYHSDYSFNLSHSLSYSIVTYWTAWLRQYYPSEFICAALTFGGESEKYHLIQETQRLNLVIVPPKINTSDVQNWVVKGKRLYVPFKECKGIGPKALETIEKYKNSGKAGFFTDDKPVIKGKLKTILDDIGAFDESLPDSIDDYFDIGVSLNPEFKYKKLFKLFKDAKNYKINDLLSGDVINEYFGREIQSKISPTKGLISCSECGLRSKCEKPETTKLGNYNILIVNEYPNWKDVENNNYLFKELNKYGFQSDDFFVTNLVKCSGSKPGHKEGQICGNKWLRQEIENIKPFIVLTLGAKNVKFFTGDEQGVVRRSGTCEWNEEYGCFMFYSISPSLALWQPENFKKLFKESIKKFADKVIDLGGFK